MEVRVLHKFHDRADFTKVYPVGETFTFEDARANYLIKRGLVEAVVEDEENAPADEGTPAEENAPEVVEESEAEVVEEPAEAVEDEETPETPVVEEKAIKPVATKRRSVSKDN